MLTCSSCGCPWHPDSGHSLSEKAQLCYGCTLHLIKWLSAHTKRKWGGADFYAAAATSVRAK